MNATAIRIGADLPELLKAIGVEFDRKGENLWFRCRSGEHEDRNPSTAMCNANSGKHGLVFCYSCKWSTDVFGLVMVVKNVGFVDAVQFVEQITKIGDLDSDEDPMVYDSLFKRAMTPVEITWPDGLVPIDPLGGCFRYLKSRGFGTEEINAYNLLDWESRSRVFIPINRDGVLISYVARSYADDKPKVLTPLKTNGSKWAIVGRDIWDRNVPTVHMSEGWASSFRIRQAGFVNSSAMCGSRLKLEQVLELDWAERIVQWQEGDHAGAGFTQDLLGWFGRRKEISVVKLPNGKDPADFAGSVLRRLFQTKELVSKGERKNGS